MQGVAGGRFTVEAWHLFSSIKAQAVSLVPWNSSLSPLGYILAVLVLISESQPQTQKKIAGLHVVPSEGVAPQYTHLSTHTGWWRNDIVWHDRLHTFLVVR